MAELCKGHRTAAGRTPTRSGKQGVSTVVVLPCWTDRAMGHDTAMSSQAPAISVQVVATVPLLQTGLERAATTAGLRVVARGEAAAATLRTPDQPPTDAPVDISAEVGRVTVTVTGSPDSGTWAATFNLLQQLLDGS
jgi:hypothetical protein